MKEYSKDAATFVVDFSKDTVIDFLKEAGIDPESTEQNDISMRIALTSFGIYILGSFITYVQEDEKTS